MQRSVYRFLSPSIRFPASTARYVDLHSSIGRPSFWRPSRAPPDPKRAAVDMDSRLPVVGVVNGPPFCTAR